MIISKHQQYIDAQNRVKAVRDAIAGQDAVKKESSTYLPYPTLSDTTSEQAKARYNRYLLGAEFEGFPAQSLTSYVGKLDCERAVIEVPERLEYLLDNADGDGLPLNQIIQNTVANIMQVKFHLLVADYQGLTGYDGNELSLLDLQRLKPRATIKQYDREAIINWHFERRNGVMQCVFLCLREELSEFSEMSMVHQTITRDLILGVDEVGYYQQVIIETNIGIDRSEKSYVTVNGKNLQWLPIQFVSDEPIISGLPLPTGMITPLCDIAYARYRVSAMYKEALSSITPTIFTSGWRGGDIEQFKEINGRDYIITGLSNVNNLPNDVSVDVISAGSSLEPYERYFEESEKRIKALGGVFSRDAGAKTATQVSSEDSELNAKLGIISTALESAIGRMIAYCGMFEGLFDSEAIEQSLDAITVKMPRDYSEDKVSVETARFWLDLNLAGKLPDDVMLELLHNGGWLDADIAQIINNLDNGG